MSDQELSGFNNSAVLGECSEVGGQFCPYKVVEVRRVLNKRLF